MNFDSCVAELSNKLEGNVFFVEIGAMDGITHDGLYKHVMGNPHWNGILVEPLDDMFSKLKATYAPRSGLSFEQAAITHRNGKAQITRIPFENVNKECPEWADGIATLKPDRHIISRYEYLKPYSVREQITTITFNRLVKKYDINRIDLLQTDTEGYDKDIFEQVWAAGFRPNLIKLEALYMTYMEILELNNLLLSNGYNCFIEGEDYIASNL